MHLLNAAVAQFDNHLSAGQRHTSNDLLRTTSSTLSAKVVRASKWSGLLGAKKSAHDKLTKRNGVGNRTPFRFLGTHGRIEWLNYTYAVNLEVLERSEFALSGDGSWE